jgi:hypothetical protein
VGTANAFPPISSISFSSRFNRSSRLAASTVIAPARANSRAVDSPIPDEAPVTMTTFPSIADRLSISMLFLSVWYEIVCFFRLCKILRAQRMILINDIDKMA